MLCPENKTPFPNELQDFGHFEHELITQSERIGNLTHTDGYTDREREKENTAKSKRLTSNRRPWPDERYKNLTAVALRETHDNEESVSRMFQRTFRRASSHSVDPRFGLSLRPRKWLGLTVVAILVAPTMAVDDQIVPLSAHTAGEVDAHNIIPNVAFGTASGVIFLITGYLSSTTRTSVGPLMGISGVLWFIMRNDEAVKPSFAWMVFGIWSMAYLMYLSYHTKRVVHERLYILLALAFSSICLFTVALVQKASIQGGLVTAIPPCASFAAYATAFCFPDRRRIVQITAV